MSTIYETGIEAKTRKVNEANAIIDQIVVELRLSKCERACYIGYLSDVRNTLAQRRANVRLARESRSDDESIFHLPACDCKASAQDLKALKTLGLERGATPAEIRSKYRALARRFHPDRGGDAAQMRKINEAYRLLTTGVKC